MAITKYTINGLSDSAIVDLQSQPNLIQLECMVDATVFTFDHTPAQSLAFKKLLATKAGLYNDSLAQYVNPRGAQLVYATDTARTFTNIGTAFVNVQARSDGMSFGVDTGQYDQVKMIVHWTKIGTGTQTVQIIDKATSTVLISMDVVSGVNVSPTNAISAALQDTSKLYLIQAKSTVAADDPVFEGIRVYMR